MFMKRKMTAAIALVAVLATAHPALAGDGAAVAAGALGGLAVGAIIGSSAAQPRYYAPPPMVVYEEPEPLYNEPPTACYWTSGEPVWDAYRGAWVRPRVQVCD
jgi:hypothetical protein